MGRNRRANELRGNRNVSAEYSQVVGSGAQAFQPAASNLVVTRQNNSERVAVRGLLRAGKPARQPRLGLRPRLVAHFAHA